MSVHSIALRTAAGFESATSRLTETILGAVEHDLAETLKAIAAEIGLCHIAYLRLSPDKSADICLLVAVVTYSRLWRHRYFVKKYMVNDPVISYGRQAVRPFDWATLPVDDPATNLRRCLESLCRAQRPFYSSAEPPRGVRGRFIHQRPHEGRVGNIQGQQYKGAPAIVGSYRFGCEYQFQIAALPVHLSTREEQCLLWAARGKTYQEIAEILGLAFGSVKTHLDGRATNYAA